MSLRYELVVFNKFTMFIMFTFQQLTSAGVGIIQMSKNESRCRTGRMDRRFRRKTVRIALLAWIEEEMQAQNFVFYSATRSCRGCRLESGMPPLRLPAGNLRGS